MGYLRKSFGRDAVHVYVGRLRGEDGCDEKFPCAGVGEGAGYVGIELVEAAQDFGDALGSEGIVGLFLCFGGWRDFRAAWTAGGGRPYTTPSFATALLFRRGLRGRGRPLHTVLAAGAGGLARGLTAGHEGNILAETSVTRAMIDSLSITR